MASFRGRRLAAQDGLSLYYRDYGDPLSPRRPLVCLTGLTRNSADFADLADRHAAERRILCLDYRGRGRSAYDSDWRNYDPRIYVSDIVHLLAANDIHRAVVVGTSLGGVLTMALAVLKPTALAAAVLNDIGPDVVPGGLVRIMGYIGTDHPQPDWPSAARYLEKLLPTMSIRGEAGWVKMAKATFREGDDGLLHFDWDVKLAKPMLAQANNTPDLWPYFAALRPVPTLVLRGVLSDVLSAETFERMARIKPDLERVSVPNSGHTPTLNEPEAAAAIDAFIRRF
ncbi:MAG TPA: alpha/beta hydrolase [Stellaceae bacterium]|nr:alpha/beta hydrolase [Stellaceae bacterium]